MNLRKIRDQKVPKYKVTETEHGWEATVYKDGEIERQKGNFPTDSSAVAWAEDSKIKDSFDGEVLAKVGGQNHSGYIFEGELFVNNTPTGVEANASDERELEELITNYIKELI